MYVLCIQILETESKEITVYKRIWFLLVHDWALSQIPRHMNCWGSQLERHNFLSTVGSNLFDHSVLAYNSSILVITYVSLWSRGSISILQIYVDVR